MSRGPVRIDLGEAPVPTPAEVPAVVDEGGAPEGRAMQTVAAAATRRRSRLAGWFWSLLGAFVSLAVTVAAYQFVADMMARYPVVGWIAAALGAALVLVLLAIVVKEGAALARLARIDAIQRRADQALASADLTVAREVSGQLAAMYAGRADLSWGAERLREHGEEVVDADTHLALAERALMGPLDARATKEVEAAARQVAAVTALVPLAFADVAAAASSNLRMIRRIAEIYGGRGGTLGNLRLTRAVFSHLVATGAVAVGDDMIGSIGGGHLVARLSRRFGEGLINGALTARVGVAAIEVCRPLPFRALRRPSVSGIVSRALTGVFDSATKKG